jgi:hypothetical protein
MSFVRRQEALDDLDRLFDTVKREKGSIDVLYFPSTDVPAI